MTTPFNTGPVYPTGPGPNPNAYSSSPSSSNANFLNIDWGNLTSAAGDWLKSHWGDLLKAGLTVYTSFEAAKEAGKNQQQSSQLMGEGIDMAKQDYASRGQYRDAAQQHLLNPTRPDLSGVFAQAGNPYARKIPSVGGQPSPGMSAPPAPPPGGMGPAGGRPTVAPPMGGPYDPAGARGQPVSREPLPAPFPVVGGPAGGGTPVMPPPGGRMPDPTMEPFPRRPPTLVPFTGIPSVGGMR